MVAELDIVSMTTGEIAPLSQLKTVQHLEGGIVLDILVREGDVVTEGQPLVILEPTATGADVGELLVRLTSLKADISRFGALISGKKTPVYPSDLIAEKPVIVEQSIQRFKAQYRRHQSELTRQKRTIQHRTQEIREIATRIQNGKRRLVLMKEQVAISDELMEEDLTNRFVHLNLLKEAEQLYGSLDTDNQALESAKLSLKEAEAQLVFIDSKFQDEYAESLDEARRTYAELFQRIKKFEDSLKRTTVRSPVDGVVKVLYVATIGGVLRPGDAVLDIVPAGDKLVIDAQLPTHDIGYVRVGQIVVVKLASADAPRFGNLDGTVVQISPDTLKTPEGQPYYKVRIETQQAYFERGGLRYDLYPGMQVMANIQTGKRTVLNYLLDPLRGNASSALQER
jgi:adhesin transport system membrane fusion protein